MVLPAPLLELDESVDVEDELEVDVEDVVVVVVVEAAEVVVGVVDVVAGVAVVVLLIEKPGVTLMLGVSRL